MPEVSSNTFIAALSRSGILPPERLAEIETQFGGQTDPKATAAALVHDGILTQWQAKFLLSGRDNLIVGKYVLLERLNQDVLGDRFLAVHQQLDRLVNLHVLPAKWTSDSGTLDKFLGEATAAAKLDYVGLIHVYDVDQQGGRYYVVSEHFEGRTLNQIIKAGEKWDLITIGGLAEQLIQGLLHTLRQGVPHRHITTKSLLVAEDQTAKISNIALGALSRRLLEDNGEFSVERAPEDDLNDLGRALLTFFDACAVDREPHERQRLRVMLDQLTRVRTTGPEADVILNNLSKWLERRRAEAEESANEARQNANARKSGIGSAAGNALKLAVPVQMSKPVAITIAVVAAGLALCAIGTSVYCMWPRGQQRIAQAATGSNVSRSGNQGADSPQASPLDLALQRKTSLELPAPPVNVAETDPPAKANAVESKEVPASDSASKVDSSIDNQAISNKDSATAEKPDANDSSAPPANPPKVTENVASETPPTDSAPPSVNPSNESQPPVVQLGQALTVQQAMKIEQNALVEPPTAPSANTSPAASGATTESAAEPNANPTKPFAAMPLAADLPAIEADSAAITLGHVDTGSNYLLGATLLCDEQMTRKTRFALVRGTGDQNQTWTVSAAPRATDNSTDIGRFWLEAGELRFQWLPDAAGNPNFNYLRNCLLKLECQNDFRYLPLRAPVTVAPPVLTAENSKTDADFNLDWLPDRDAICVQALSIGDPPKIDQTDAFLFNYEPVEQVVPDKGPLSVFLTRKADHYLVLEINAKISRKSSVSADLLVRRPIFGQPQRLDILEQSKSKTHPQFKPFYSVPPVPEISKPRTYSEKRYQETESILLEDIEMTKNLLTTVNSIPHEVLEDEGRITAHKDAVSELGKVIEAKNLNVTNLQEEHNNLDHLFSQPIKFRVCFNVTVDGIGHPVDLATWDGNVVAQPVPVITGSDKK